jgi:hypothetical protein
VEQISALQAEVERLTESGDFQLSERTRLREERDTLKRENAALRLALQRALRDLELCVVGHSDPAKKAARDPPDAARKEQG